MKNINSVLLVLLVAVLSANSQEDCSPFLQKERDKFTDQVTIYTPLSSPLIMNKVILKGIPIYYLSITVTGSTITVGKKGVSVLFSDGTKLLRPNEEIDSKVSSDGSGFEYSCFVELKKSEVEVLSKKKITDVKLYIYDREIESSVASKFTCTTAAILKAK